MNGLEGLEQEYEKALEEAQEQAHEHIIAKYMRMAEIEKIRQEEKKSAFRDVLSDIWNRESGEALLKLARYINSDYQAVIYELANQMEDISMKKYGKKHRALLKANGLSVAEDKEKRRTKSKPKRRPRCCQHFKFPEYFPFYGSPDNERNYTDFETTDTENEISYFDYEIIGYVNAGGARSLLKLGKDDNYYCPHCQKTFSEDTQLSLLAAAQYYNANDIIKGDKALMNIEPVYYSIDTRGVYTYYDASQIEEEA